MEHSLPITENRQDKQILRLALPYMLLGGAVLIAYFLILRIFGLHLYTQLRWVNFLLMAPFIAHLSNKYVKTRHGKTYLEIMALNFVTFLGAFLVHSIFMFLYLTILDPEMMRTIQAAALPELQLTPFTSCVLLMGEASVAALIISFAATQYYQYRIRRMA